MAEVDILNSIPHLLMSPSMKTWIDCGDEADVLYISFYKPQRANDSFMEGNIVYHSIETVSLWGLRYCARRRFTSPPTAKAIETTQRKVGNEAI